jgi:hypothetical protein
MHGGVDSGGGGRGSDLEVDDLVLKPVDTTLVSLCAGGAGVSGLFQRLTIP